MQHIPLDQQYPRLSNSPRHYHPGDIPLDIYAIDPIEKSAHQNTNTIGKKNLLFLKRTTNIRAHLYSPGHPNIPTMTMTWSNECLQKTNIDIGTSSSTTHNETYITLALSEPLALHDIFDLQSTMHIPSKPTKNNHDLPPQHLLFHYKATEHNIPQNGQELITILRHAWKNTWYQPAHYVQIHALHHALYHAAIDAFHTQPRHCQYHEYNREHSIYQCNYDSINNTIYMDVSLPNPPYPRQPPPKIRINISVFPSIATYIPNNFHHINHTHGIPTNIHARQQIPAKYTRNNIILHTEFPRPLTQHENIQYQRQRRHIEQILNKHPLHVRSIHYLS